MTEAGGSRVVLLSSDERDHATERCGEPTSWGLREHCDAALDQFLSGGCETIAIAVEPELRSFVCEYLERSIRERVLSQCQGTC